MPKCPISPGTAVYIGVNIPNTSCDPKIIKESLITPTGGQKLKIEEKKDFKAKVWRIIHSIPRGQVATYGQIAGLADHPNQARLVGKILSQLPNDSNLPWYRVLNAQGRISSPGSDTQKLRLADEGIVLVNGRVNLKLYRWEVAATKGPVG